MADNNTASPDIMQHIICRKIITTDLNALLHYLDQLSTATKQRFEPHPFNRDGVINFYNTYEGLTAYIAINTLQQEIIAYAIIKNGMLQHDRERLLSYGSFDLHRNYCSFAPSVADKWQSRGIGKQLFHHILSDLKAANINSILLWGGVQAGNDRAVHFYNRLGFHTLGTFEYNGLNIDMLLHIR
jgi:GNAT superfamily N-acetyltransferase